jgi:hypothetical protein
MGFVLLESLVDTAPAQAGRRRNLANRQPSLVCRHDRPDPFLICGGQARSRETQPCFELLFLSDAVS